MDVSLGLNRLSSGLFFLFFFLCFLVLGLVSSRKPARILFGGRQSRDKLDVKSESLHLVHEHEERGGDIWRSDLFSLDNRLIRVSSADHVVGLYGKHLLQGIGGAVALKRPDLHFSTPLTAEPGLSAKRLLGNERVRTYRAHVNLVLNEVI